MEAQCDFKSFNTMSLMSFKCNDPVFMFLLKPSSAQFSSAVSMTVALVSVDCYGRTQEELQRHSRTKTREAREDETVAIRLR